MLNVLMLSTTFIPSVLLCGHCQMDYLESEGKVNYRFIPSHFVQKKNVEWADIIIFLRSDTDIDAYVSKVARKAGKHLIYVLDDDILNCPSYLSCAPYYLLKSTQNNIKTIMANCDTFLTPSPVLLEKYGSSFKNKFLISEPSLNRIKVKEKNPKIKIGFAGSIDRVQDINEILENTIERLVNKYQDKIEIEFMGAKPRFLERLGLKFLPYQDGYDAYTAYMASMNWDIGLAPMPESKFHECKYFNKYIEYASFGIVGVYSNVKPYVFGIKDNENGLLVNNDSDSWFNAIAKLIDDDELRTRISKNCIKEANEKYALDILALDYFEKIQYGFKKKEYGSIPGFALAKALFFIKRVYRKIKQEGSNFPNWLNEKIKKKLDERKEKIEYLKNSNLLKDIVDNKKTIFIIGPYNKETKDEYNNRIQEIDKKIIDEGYYPIYLNGEDRSLEYIKPEFIDDKHIVVTFNSYDIKQSNLILDLIGKSKLCLIHGVNRFVREKLASEMYKVFDLDDVTVVWDAHGSIPENYHKLNNFYMEKVTNEIEKRFYDKADVLICNNEELIKHFKDKYQERKDMRYIVII